MKSIIVKSVVILGLLTNMAPKMMADYSSENVMRNWPKAKVTEKSFGMVPRWITSSPPKPKSGGYDIFRCEAEGNTKDAALLKIRRELINKLAVKHDVRVDENLTDIEKIIDEKDFQNNEVFIQKIGDRADAVFKCQSIDTYWEKRGGKYYVVELFATTGADKEITDKFTTTTSYGAAPVFYSLIPGVGQMYKGSTVKGGIILGSAVVVGAGIITAESLRASYIKKMKEYPKHHDFYNNKATTWKNIRNVTIGVGAGLYLYNLIDAAVASGRPRVIVTPKRSYYYSLAPTWDGESVGLAFNLTF